MSAELRAAVVGATGYSGREIVQWLQRHPAAAPAVLTGSKKSLAELARFTPHLPEAAYLPFRYGENLVEELLDALAARKVQVVFLATEAETSLGLAPELLQRGMVVIDISAAYRLKDAALYEAWYGFKHPQPELLRQAVYGLTEYARKELAGASLIANPGCYPTSIQLAILPILDWVDWQSAVICDSKSGLTGAGRNAEHIFAEINENVQPYKLGNHRHVPEILQGLGQKPGGALPFAFSPHLVPMNRGILSTCYFRTREDPDEAKMRARYLEIYPGSPFVSLLPAGMLPQTQVVAQTNRCEIAVVVNRQARLVTVVSAIDNLVKGAAGQAIQNMNIRFGFPESAGLR